MGRNAMHGPGRWTVDLSLSKNIRIGEAKRIQLRADLFNATNHTNLNNPTIDANNARFGQITGSGSGRQTQLSLRFDF